MVLAVTLPSESKITLLSASTATGESVTVPTIALPSESLTAS